jgi:predicted PurR-regulated permease PerM
MTSPERTPVPPGASLPTGTSARGDGSPPDATVHHGLKITAAYAWRLIVVAVAVYLVFVALAKLTLVAVAVFVGLVITALLRPLVDLLARWLPRGMAVAVALLLTIVTLGGVFTFVADSVAGQSAKLSAQFISGLNDLERSLAGAPLHLRAVDLNQLGQQIRSWVTQNGGSLAGQALGGAGVAVEVLTGLALAVFCSVFFLSSGNRIWTWLLTQAGGNTGRLDGAARAGWATFAGYTRGIVIIAGTNAALVCVALLILRVPLALPLALLTFFATFIPLIGSPIALFVATLVALAARGPLVALLVLALIVVIGQIEGHLLQPLVMSRAVNIHPLAVALTVASGTILYGVIGAVVAVPVVAVAWKVWTSLRTHPSRADQRREPAVEVLEPHPDAAT